MSRNDATPGRPPAFEVLEEFLDTVSPGGCARARRYRAELLTFACTPTARTLFLTSAGARGMEIARLVALLRTTALMQPEAARRRLEVARVVPGGLADYRLLAGSFEELDAAAMREADAIQELLGRPAADGLARPGVFERAMLLEGRRTDAVELTGGFVHVREPADLSRTAQAVLASVSDGAPFPRVGDSEEGEDLLAFEGVLICTTRRDVAADGLRVDVARRIAGREIAVPRLSELTADFGVQVDAALQRVRADYRRFTDRFSLSADAARDYWHTNQPPARLSSTARAALAGVDWARHGEDEGLLQAVRAIVAGGAPAEVVRDLARPASVSRADPADLLLRRLETLDGHDGKGLAGRVRAVEREVRAALKVRLRSDAAAMARLARKVGVTPDTLAAQVAQIDRTRTTDAEAD